MDSNSVILIFVVLYALVIAGSFYYFFKNEMIEKNFTVRVMAISAAVLALGIFGFVTQNLFWLVPCAILGGTAGAILIGQSARIGYIKSNPEIIANGVKLSNKEIDARRTSDVLVRKVSFNLSNDKFSEDTMEQLKKAARIDPLNSEAFHLLAYLSVEQGNMEDALKYVNNALEIEPDNVDYLDLLDYITDTGPSA
ncbi:MAG: hypothetical protein JW738_10285 [Actinobacteria bacterium]|nr:hypothetical protein [Actinomycetota bacterium]